MKPEVKADKSELRIHRINKGKSRAASRDGVCFQNHFRNRFDAQRKKT